MESAESSELVGLDPAWIATALGSGGFRPDVEFAGFIGTGQMSRNARFRVDWGSRPGPTSVVVKLPSGEAGTRAVSFEHRIYERECEFYRVVAPLVEVSRPEALAVHFDRDAPDFAIVLEDLAGSEQGDQFAEPTEHQLLLAIDQAGALQAPVWQATGGPAFDCYRDDIGERAAGADLMVPHFVAAVFDRLGPGLDPDVVELLDRFRTLASTWVRMRSTPTTLVHGDFRPDNFMFGVDPGAPAIAIVDWQTLSLGPGVIDVAYLLGGALEPSHRRSVEHEMLAAYRRALAVRGVNYTEAECLSDYTLGSLHGIMVAITATTMADQTERGDALFTLMINRHGRHALDCGALDRVAETAAGSR